MKKWNAILFFVFTEFLIFQLFFSGLYAAYYHRYGLIEIAHFVIFKTIFYGLSIGYYYLKRREKFYFFHNLGVNKRTLLLMVLLLDTFLSGISVYLINLYRF